MQIVHAYRFVDHAYAHGWASLNNDEYVATLKLTPPKVVKQGMGYDEGDTYIQYTRVPRGVDSNTISQALRDTMGGTNCKHEYDCCGCASRSVWTKKVAPRCLQIITRVNFNY